MRLLLDTHVLLWALSTPKHLSKKVRSEIENPANDVMFSAASIWEIAIKWTLKSGFRELPVRSTAAAHVAALPTHHRDPFDRLLIAQAVTEPAILYTADPQLEIYSELVHRIQ